VYGEDGLLNTAGQFGLHGKDKTLGKGTEDLEDGIIFLS
jgi:hypothetical protein